jgi:hypothetical protein
MPAQSHAFIASTVSWLRIALYGQGHGARWAGFASHLLVFVVHVQYMVWAAPDDGRAATVSQDKNIVCCSDSNCSYPVLRRQHVQQAHCGCLICNASAWRAPRIVAHQREGSHVTNAWQRRTPTHFMPQKAAILVPSDDIAAVVPAQHFSVWSRIE